MRLDKYLADMGYGTRKDIRKLIRDGRICVGGLTVREPSLLVKENEGVSMDGKPIIYEPLVYYMLHKPAGVITATRDGREETVLDLLEKPLRTDLFPVGRLDRDTEGLLLITNDGALAHRLLSPKGHVDKVYYAKVRGRVGQEEVSLFERGLSLSDMVALPARLEVLRAGELSEVMVTLWEGKFHQVKRMFEAVGKEVLYLKRLSMGGLCLDEDLLPGHYRRLLPKELEALKKSVGAS